MYRLTFHSAFIYVVVNTASVSILWRKITFHSLFIAVLVNTASVSILFRDTSYFGENERFIHFSFLFLVKTASVSILFRDTSYFGENERFIHFSFLFLVNTAPVSILFRDTSYFGENERFIHCSFLFLINTAFVSTLFEHASFFLHSKLFSTFYLTLLAVSKCLPFCFIFKSAYPSHTFDNVQQWTKPVWFFGWKHNPNRPQISLANSFTRSCKELIIICAARNRL